MPLLIGGWSRVDARRRADEVPSPLKLGISILTAGVGLAQRVVGDDTTTSFLRGTSLPFVGELSRMVRSLAFAFIWETWPNTLPWTPSSAASLPAVWPIWS